MAEKKITEAILMALGNRFELSGPILRENANLSSEDFYAVILQLESDRKVKSRWAEGVSPMVRLYRLADVRIGQQG